MPAPQEDEISAKRQAPAQSPLPKALPRGLRRPSPPLHPRGQPSTALHLPSAPDASSAQAPSKATAYNKATQATALCCGLSALWYHQESNRGHTDFQSVALPTELWYHTCLLARAEATRFELVVRLPVRQFSKLLVSATHPHFLDFLERLARLSFAFCSAKIERLFQLCKSRIQIISRQGSNPRRIYSL